MDAGMESSAGAGGRKVSSHGDVQRAGHVRAAGDGARWGVIEQSGCHG